jgi:hypothetical protein
MAAPSVDGTNVTGQKPVVDIVESSPAPMPTRISVPRISVNYYELELR